MLQLTRFAPAWMGSTRKPVDKMKDRQRKAPRTDSRKSDHRYSLNVVRSGGVIAPLAPRGFAAIRAGRPTGSWRAWRNW